jgi:hypothetical protein
MNYREERAGGAIAGAVLLALSALDVLLGASSPGLVHFVVRGFSLGVFTARQARNVTAVASRPAS